MMDFLRRLSPARETDVTRAFALLPSRFAGENPLQATMAQARPAQRPYDDEAALSPEPASPPAASDTVAAPPHLVDGKATSPIHAAVNDKATLPAYAPAEAPGIHVSAPRAFADRHGENPERARPANSKRQELAVALAASPGLQNVTAPPAQARVALPLSQAMLAQRTLQSRNDSQVVHVTIGRIDVVANTAPAPAVRRSPAPRQGTVTLADYLRGSHGGRQ